MYNGTHCVPCRRCARRSPRELNTLAMIQAGCSKLPSYRHPKQSNLSYHSKFIHQLVGGFSAPNLYPPNRASLICHSTSPRRPPYGPNIPTIVVTTITMIAIITITISIDKFRHFRPRRTQQVVCCDCRHACNTVFNDVMPYYIIRPIVGMS